MERERSDIIQAGTQLRPHLPGHGHKYGSVTWNIGIVQRLTEAGRLCKRPSGRTEGERRDTDLDVGAFRLHEFADDFAQLVGIGELPQGGGRREGRIRAGGRGHALGGIHLMEAATEGGDLLRALQEVRGREGGKTKNCIKMCNCGRWHAAKEKVQLSISLQVLLSTY